MCPGWSVKDVAAHLLGDYVGRLSLHRDRFQVLRPRADEAFPAFLDRINEEWGTASRRVSPPLLVDLLSVVSDELVRFWRTVDLDAVGASEYWAGPEPHPSWLDLAREYTEYWTHQQQIRKATARPGLTKSRYLGSSTHSYVSCRTRCASWSASW